jgi:hypothetical protein
VLQKLGRIRDYEKPMILLPVHLDAGQLDVMGVIMESALTVKGQATIPKAIREHLHLKPGDRVKFFFAS